MSDPRYKLPKSVLILNIIMVVLILAICGLAFSLAYSQMKGDEEETSLSSTADSGSPDEPDESGAEAVTTTTTPKSSVSMTKRTTEPTEPVSEPATTPAEETAEPQTGETEQPDTSYTKSFFESDLFIGDSITTGLSLYGKLDMRCVAASVGYTPYKAYTETVDLYDGTAMTALDYAKKIQPKRIFIMLGSNGILSADAMKDSYKALVDKLNVACPDSAVYCLAVPPVTSDSSAAARAGITNDMISGFNDYIKGLCGEYGMKYFDIYTLMLDDEGYFSHDFAEVDGMHFKGTAYDVMLSYIQKELS